MNVCISPCFLKKRTLLWSLARALSLLQPRPRHQAPGPRGWALRSWSTAPKTIALLKVPSAALFLLLALASIPFHRLRLHTNPPSLQSSRRTVSTQICSVSCIYHHPIIAIESMENRCMHGFVHLLVCCMECIHGILLINHFLINRWACSLYSLTCHSFLTEGYKGEIIA